MNPGPLQRARMKQVALRELQVVLCMPEAQQIAVLERWLTL